ncbi:MAG: hypothetical protein LLG04_04550, partial [Parachlamydia sp.]|nr:hypothetical protein [Parachlamydia sp.]
MRIEAFKENTQFLNRKPFTVMYRYRNPFTHLDVTRQISLTTGDKFKIALATIAGLLLGIIGAPFLFFFASRKLREMQIQEIKDLNPADSKITTLKRLLGPAFATQVIVHNQVQLSQLPLDRGTIDPQCIQIKLCMQFQLHANKFSESLVVNRPDHAPLAIAEIEEAIHGKLDALRQKIISSGRLLSDQKLENRVVGLMKMQDQTWGYTRGIRSPGTYYTSHAVKLS